MLETFLSDYREKREHRQQKRRLGHSVDVSSSSSLTADEDESVPSNQGGYHSDTGGGIDEDDVSFTTPVDPKGVEIVINLLSTWGDRFYIGLSGIEMYTKTGEPARVQKVSVCTHCDIV